MGKTKETIVTIKIKRKNRLFKFKTKKEAENFIKLLPLIEPLTGVKWAITT